MPSKSHKKHLAKKVPIKKTFSETKKESPKTWESDHKADRDYDESLESPRAKNH